MHKLSKPNLLTGFRKKKKGFWIQMEKSDVEMVYSIQTTFN